MIPAQQIFPSQPPAQSRHSKSSTSKHQQIDRILLQRRLRQASDGSMISERAAPYQSSYQRRSRKVRKLLQLRRMHHRSQSALAMTKERNRTIADSLELTAGNKRGFGTDERQQTLFVAIACPISGGGAGYGTLTIPGLVDGCSRS